MQPEGYGQGNIPSADSYGAAAPQYGAPGYGTQPTGYDPSYGNYSQQPQYGQPGYMQGPAPSNTMSLLGVILGVLFPPAGIVLSAMGLKRAVQGSRGLAVTGLVVSIVFLGGWVAGGVVLAQKASDPKPVAEETSSSSQEKPKPKPTSSQSEPDPEPTETDDPYDYSIPSGPVLAFGETATYSDGLAFTISEPESFTPSDYAMPESGTPFKVNVTVTNGTSEPADLILFLVIGVSAGQEIEAIYDFDQDVEIFGPSDPVPPGETVTFSLAFAAEDTDDITLTASTGFDYDYFSFTNK